MDITLAIGGVSLPVAIFAVIELLKFGELIRGELEIRRAVIVVALLFATLWVALEFYEPLVPYVGTVVTALVGAALAAVGYQGFDRLRTRRNGG